LQKNYGASPHPPERYTSGSDTVTAEPAALSPPGALGRGVVADPEWLGEMAGNGGNKQQFGAPDALRAVLFQGRRRSSFRIPFVGSSRARYAFEGK